MDELGGAPVDAPLLAIVGPSGSGKSSLLRAGLLPALGLGTRALPPRPSVPDGRGRRRSSAPYRRSARARGRPVRGALLTALTEETRRAFVDALVDAAWDPERRALILIALRADFFGQLAPYVELADLVGPNHVAPRADEHVGTAPRDRRAGRADGPRRRACARRPLVDDVAGEAGGLPLLSTALRRPLARRDGRVADGRRLRADRRRARCGRAICGGGVRLTRRRRPQGRAADPAPARRGRRRRGAAAPARHA